MRTLALAAAITTITTIGTPAAAQPAAPGFGWFGELAGSCWTGRLPDGQTVHTQCYTWQFDRFLRGTARLLTPSDGRLTLRFEGDSLFAWDASTRRITYYLWGSDGSHRQLEAQYVGEELSFPVPSRKDPTQLAYRSVWRRLGDNSFEVRRERPAAAGGWTVEMTVVYERSATGTQAESATTAR